MKCETCGSLLTEDNAVVKLIDENLEYDPTILCWYCEEDAKEPDPYVGGMEPKSVFPLMDELEAEWGVADD